MARKERNTVDYFPHICGDGKKMFFIETKYGNDGYATWYKILENLAVTEMHYLNLSNEADVMFLAARCRISEDRLLSIVSDLSKIGAINQFLWSVKIVWSDMFIENIQDAYERRKNKCITFDGLCTHLSSLGIQLPTKCIHNDDINTHTIVYNTKEENTKEEKSKEKDINIGDAQTNFYNSLLEFLPEFGKDTVRDFFNYWSEPNQKKTKLRYQMEKTWETKKRLATWKRNESKFKPACNQPVNSTQNLLNIYDSLQAQYPVQEQPLNSEQ